MATKLSASPQDYMHWYPFSSKGHDGSTGLFRALHFVGLNNMLSLILRSQNYQNTKL